MSTVLEEYHLDLQHFFDSCIVFFDFDILSSKEKYFLFQCFILIFHLIVDFQSLLTLISVQSLTSLKKKIP